MRTSNFLALILLVYGVYTSPFLKQLVRSTEMNNERKSITTTITAREYPVAIIATGTALGRASGTTSASITRTATTTPTTSPRTITKIATPTTTPTTKIPTTPTTKIHSVSTAAIVVSTIFSLGVAIGFFIVAYRIIKKRWFVAEGYNLLDLEEVTTDHAPKKY
uniref:Syndecan/Neurexin domain-containing protein n=1 Tax=Octopus bimaculoides TaxID=37653 RepID=A0A0L8G9F3_OCTBM